MTVCMCTNRFWSLLDFVVISSEAVSLRREARTEPLRDEGERGGVLLTSNLH